MKADRQAVRELAYELWLARGRPEGSPEADWYAAELHFSEQETFAAAREVEAMLDSMTTDTGDAAAAPAGSPQAKAVETEWPTPPATQPRRRRKGSAEGRETRN